MRPTFPSARVAASGRAAAGVRTPAIAVQPVQALRSVHDVTLHVDAKRGRLKLSRTAFTLEPAFTNFVHLTRLRGDWHKLNGLEPDIKKVAQVRYHSRQRDVQVCWAHRQAVQRVLETAVHIMAQLMFLKQLDWWLADFQGEVRLDKATLSDILVLPRAEALPLTLVHECRLGYCTQLKLMPWAALTKKFATAWTAKQYGAYLRHKSKRLKRRERL